jgi:UDP-N-acetyl-D-mannosaminuronic acid dehydrogenase
VADYSGVPIVAFVEEAVRGADAIVIFAAHHHYKALDAAYLKMLTGKAHPAIVDGRNLIDPDVFINHGFIYKGIGRGDKNGHAVVEK